MDSLENITTNCSPSTVNPVKAVDRVVSNKEPFQAIENLYKLYDIDAERSYKKGTVARINSDVKSVTVLSQIIELYISTVREKLSSIDNAEERSRKGQELTKIHKVLEASMSLLSKDDFLLDVSAVIHIIHGYVIRNVKPIFENYETRRRTTHQHIGEGSDNISEQKPQNDSI
tara:strand:- start:479 stop:997 length:519 start_codon:yes stop_codon:yes gene_type:complete